ncbi:unnamed protein product [Plutella xylostella]|uniref:(diamondback moth) hypothetical protein n=1 Tax=Plutella xylostella TaxID=51655 RepID=A0A8S4DQ44_PLUXY|nr:unnamed protein product [Plutella xylostella]
MEKLAAKQLRLVNRSRPLLLQDNARPHTAQQTATKLEELQLECLRHPPYSPDLAPTDNHFFRNLDNYLQGKKFNSDGAVESGREELKKEREIMQLVAGLQLGPDELQRREGPPHMMRAKYAPR